MDVSRQRGKEDDWYAGICNDKLHPRYVQDSIKGVNRSLFYTRSHHNHKTGLYFEYDLRLGGLKEKY